MKEGLLVDTVVQMVQILWSSHSKCNWLNAAELGCDFFCFCFVIIVVIGGPYPAQPYPGGPAPYPGGANPPAGINQYPGYPAYPQQGYF